MLKQCGVNTTQYFYRNALAALGFVFGVSLVSAADAAALQAGPMVGPTAMRSATVWLQADSPATARVIYWEKSASGQSTSQKKSASDTVRLLKTEDFTAHVLLDGLEPGRHYAYQVVLNGKPAGKINELVTQSLWQWRTDPPNFRVLIGSCAYINEPVYDRPGSSYGGGTEIFSAMAAAKPDLTVWMGDNLYFREVDYDSPAGMAARYRHDRALPQLQSLLSTGSHAAIWDDHDYGPNDSNSSFIFKQQALTLFERYWVNPSYGVPGLPGTFTVVHQGDADFFLLDNRWYRDDDKLLDDNKVMFGEQQMHWLKNALLNSVATFKFIVGGSQLLDRSSPYEGWRNFGNEREQFLQWLDRQRVPGVMFLSGDRHHTELLQWPREGNYTLYELTCSPLTSGTHDINSERQNPSLVAGTLVGERNFCGLDFSGKEKQRQMTLRVFDGHGKEVWSKPINSQELGYQVKAK